MFIELNISLEYEFGKIIGYYKTRYWKLKSDKIIHVEKLQIY